MLRTMSVREWHVPMFPVTVPGRLLAEVRWRGHCGHNPMLTQWRHLTLDVPAMHCSHRFPRSLPTADVNIRAGRGPLGESSFEAIELP